MNDRQRNFGELEYRGIIALENLRAMTSRRETHDVALDLRRDVFRNARIASNVRTEDALRSFFEDSLGTRGWRRSAADFFGDTARDVVMSEPAIDVLVLARSAAAYGLVDGALRLVDLRLRISGRLRQLLEEQMRALAERAASAMRASDPRIQPPANRSMFSPPRASNTPSAPPAAAVAAEPSAHPFARPSTSSTPAVESDAARVTDPSGAPADALVDSVSPEEKSPVLSDTEEKTAAVIGLVETLEEETTNAEEASEEKASDDAAETA